MSSNYRAADIEVLSGLEPVRRRPGMYTDTTRPNHLAHEVVDNSVDEAVAGHAKKIDVDAVRRRLAASRRRRPRHARRHPSAGEAVRRRADPHAAARGRQVLEQELPVLGRLARRRRLGRQRAVEESRGLDSARRQGIQHELCRRRAPQQARGRRQGRQDHDRHDGALLAEPEVLRLAADLAAAPEARAAREGRALPGPRGHARGREAEGVRALGLHGRARAVSQGVARATATSCPSSRSRASSRASARPSSGPSCGGATAAARPCSRAT